MDRQFNKKRLFALGDWLEKFLNPKITLIDYKSLLKESQKLYDFHFIASENDFTYQIIENVKKLNPEAQINLYNYTHETIGPKPPNWKPFDLIDNEDAQTLKKSWNEIDHFSSSGLAGANDFVIYFDILLYDTYKLFSVKTMILMALSYLLKNKDLISWKQIIQIPDIRIEDFKSDLNTTFACRVLLDYYNQMVKSMAINEKEEIHFSYIFQYDTVKFNKEGSHYFTKNFDGKHYSIFPWHIIAAHIFWDFLSISGQNYITFCKHCGRFSLSKRLKPDGSSEKVFCSAICRTAFRRV